jgi:HSP20 family protein
LAINNSSPTFLSIFAFSKFFGGERRGFDDNVFRGTDWERIWRYRKKNTQLVREYIHHRGVREVGPIVYGYSMTIGPEGKPKAREFGKVKVRGFN